MGDAIPALHEMNASSLLFSKVILCHSQRDCRQHMAECRTKYPVVSCSSGADWLGLNRKRGAGDASLSIETVASRATTHSPDGSGPLMEAVSSSLSHEVSGGGSLNSLSGLTELNLLPEQP